MHARDPLARATSQPLDPATATPGSFGYEEMLRAIGHLLDAEGWCNICLRQHGSAIHIMAQQTQDPAGSPVAFALTRGELAELIAANRARRGTGRATVLLAAADAAQRG